MEEPLRGRQFKTVGKRDRFAEKRSGTETEQIVEGRENLCAEEPN